MADIPPFQPRFPWVTGDLQTLRNVLRPPRVAFDPARSVPLTIPLDDGTGDVLSGELHEPAEDMDRPLVVLLHGLTGCFDSDYVRVSADFWLRAGYPVFRTNLRAAGPINRLCREQYYAGRTADLVTLFDFLAAREPERALVAVGYSLGGNMLLKYLGEQGHRARLAGAATVSVPIDLAATSAHFHSMRNYVYRRYLVRRMRAMTLALRDLPDDWRRTVRQVRTVYEFDDRYIAPRYGFGDAPRYYATNSAAGFLPDIRVPTLVVHAADDPWIPVAPYRAVNWAGNPALTLALTDRGGHVGFHGKDSRTPWHDRRIGAHFNALRLGRQAARQGSEPPPGP